MPDQVVQITDWLRKSLERQPSLQDGGGNGTSDGMEARVTRLEEQQAIVGERLTSMDGKLDEIRVALARQPTRAELLGYAIGSAALLFTILSIFIAGLAWLGDRASQAAATATASPQPIIIQVPSPK